jgi:uncharacterized protein (DUF2235 family)
MLRLWPTFSHGNRHTVLSHEAESAFGLTVFLNRFIQGQFVQCRISNENRHDSRQWQEQVEKCCNQHCCEAPEVSFVSLRMSEWIFVRLEFDEIQAKVFNSKGITLSTTK